MTRARLVLAAAGLGVAGALLPATSASAVCMQLPTGQCVTPCVAGVWNTTADTVNEQLGDDSPVAFSHMYCLM